MANTYQITPCMHVRDLKAALAFLGSLGFEVQARQSNYAYVDREGAAIRLFEWRDAPVFTHEQERYGYYIDVRDVDALHAELKPALDALPAGHVEGPTDKPWTQRELSIVAPDGQLLVFGSAIAK
jgi:catechol 2,3-dioxygenase-like lactoylglutathione lyase family enzyme